MGRRGEAPALLSVRKAMESVSRRAGSATSEALKGCRSPVRRTGESTMSIMKMIADNLTQTEGELHLGDKTKVTQLAQVTLDVARRVWGPEADLGATFCGQPPWTVT